MSDDGDQKPANGVDVQRLGGKSASWTRRLNPFRRREGPHVPSGRQPTAEHEASFLSALCFQWITSLLSAGYRRPLELHDIWEVNPDRQVAPLVRKFNSALARRRSSSLKRVNSLTLALFDTSRADFLLGAICQLVAGCFQVLSPFLAKYLIRFAQDAYQAGMTGSAAPKIGSGIGLAIGLALMLAVQSLCMNHFYYRSMVLGGQSRSVLIACVFEKATKVSGRAKAGGLQKGEEGWSNGRINGLISTDAARVDAACVTLHRCWVAPIQLLLALVLLCINLGYSALVGFGVICVVTPLLGRAIKILMVHRKAINEITDQRQRLTQETFGAIRTVKIFAWESKLLARLSVARDREIKKLARLLDIRNAILATAIVLPMIASMLTFITYSLSGHALEAGPVFSSLALFNALGLPLEILPLAIGRAVDALAAISRISQFLDAEEHEDNIKRDSSLNCAFTVEQAAFTWEQSVSNTSRESSTESNAKLDVAVEPGPPTRDPFALLDVNFDAGRTDLIAVIGTVGSGKSSLISALAGEMRKTHGDVTFGASRALCSQTPWILNATVRENVTFGKDFDPVFYQQVIEACSLQADLDSLPYGDMTQIGEKGVTISGGQKQRINMARTIYFDAEVVLLDDPLSAVDSHVGKHILDHAICGLLKDKCRILVTHQLHILRRVDRIVWMKHGRVHKWATYGELIRDDPEFRDLFQSSHGQDTQKQENTSVTEGDTLEVSEQGQKAKTNSNAPKSDQAEEKATGSVSISAYAAYMRASGSFFNFVLVVLALIIAQGANIVTGLWLSWWTSTYLGNLQTGQYAGIYAGLGFSTAIFMFAYATALTTFSTRAGRNILMSALAHTMGAPMRFFDTTPMGRLTSRFSTDVDTLDNRLTDNLRFLLFLIATIVSVFCLILVYFYYFIAALVPLTIVFVLAASYYRSSAREIKRHEANLRSAVFAHLGEAITGTSTIRAYGMQERFISKLALSIDSMNGAYYLTFAGQRWLSVRLDILGSLLVLVLGILVVTSRFNVNPSISGLTLSYMLSIVQLIQTLVHTYAEVQNNMNSVERLHYYSRALEQEEPKDAEHADVSAKWPDRGTVRFEQATLRYRPELPLVLQGLSFNVRSGERIGIVGRTGAGKTSILSALFRLTELSSGAIIIDDMNIATLSLQTLRSRLSIIPQDATLFSGTVRSNLDPFEEHDDHRLWSALRQAGLANETLVAAGWEGRNGVTLDSPVEEEGRNFSLGERQLLALARALLKDSQVVMFDEATSSIDMETDRKVQDTILEAFKGKTLLCIAHRLDTIIG